MDAPITQVMPRTGRGTKADNEAGNTRALEWQAAVEKFERGGWFWLSTVAADGRAHSMPCFAAWSGSSFFTSSSRASPAA
jgi:hypothetical protein